MSRIHIKSTGTSRDGANCELGLAGLSTEELEKFQGVLTVRIG